MLTGAVRDLHRHYPDQFLTDVRTSAPELWRHNPYITPLSDEDPACLKLNCHYPQNNHARREPLHCLQSFVDLINRQLNLKIRPTEFRGDIHLSPSERSWFSQVHEQVGQDVPFWIVCAGGKYDTTIKWWSLERYQEVVDSYQGKILFVQVGQRGQWHPLLENAIDLRGRTSIRQLIRLVHHAEGVLCGVTFPMHLAAATPIPRGRSGQRPCVVVAGGREPPHWKAYPGHQFVHTIGALECCATEGCWKSRITPLYDHDPRDAKEKRCVDVRNDLPHCMDLITSKDIIERIRLYFDGGVCQMLSKSEQEAITIALESVVNNRPNTASISASSALLSIDQTLKTLPNGSPPMRGTGIVCCAGTEHFFNNAIESLRRLRESNTVLPIELWKGDSYSIPNGISQELETLNIRIVNTDASHAPNTDWRLKAYALVHTRFRHVLLLDADSIAVDDPAMVFQFASYKLQGLTAWKDVVNIGAGDPSWRWFRLNPTQHLLLDTGQVAIDRKKHWKCVQFIKWLAIQASFFDAFLGGNGCMSFAIWKTAPHFVPEDLISNGSQGVISHCGPQETPLFEHRSGQRNYCSPPSFQRRKNQPTKSYQGTKRKEIYHGFIHHHPLDKDTQRRNQLAADSRRVISQSSPWQLCEIDYDNLPRLFRDGGRRLPFVKDVISLLLKTAPQESIIILTNTDVCLSPEAPVQICDAMKSTEACYSSRRDFDRLNRLLDLSEIQGGQRFSGVDLVAFLKEWWLEQADSFPDLLLGAEAWDWCFRVLIQKQAKDHGKGFDDLVYHERHQSFWFRDGNLATLPSQQWNRSLAKPFLQKMGRWPEHYPW